MTSSRVLVINNGTLSLNQLRQRFHDLGSRTDTVEAAAVPARLDGRYQAVVLSGTKVRAYDSDYYRRLIDLVMDSTVPVFAICGAYLAGETVETGHHVPGGWPPWTC